MNLKLLILDIDGILTDGTKVYDIEHKPIYKRFMCKDFTAIKRFSAAGIKVIMISGDNWNRTMAEKRNIDFYCTREKGDGLDKSLWLQEFKNTYKVVSRFKKKYPNYRYIGICIQPFNSLVLNFQRDSGILSEDQYAMINFENGSKKWVLTLLNKGLIVDENQVIKEGFGVFTSNNFESILQEFHKN